MEDVGRHAASLLARLNHQREQAHLCDCVLRQTLDPAHLYPAHKCVLAAASPVLATILSSTGSLVDLQAPYLADSVLELVLDFIYTGVPPPARSWQQYRDLLAAARLLEMEQLREVLVSAPPMEMNEASSEPFRACGNHMPLYLDHSVAYTTEVSKKDRERRIQNRVDKKHVVPFTAHVDQASPLSSCGPVPVIRHSSRAATMPSSLQVASVEENHQYRNKHCIDDSHEIPLVEVSYSGNYSEDMSVREDHCIKIQLEDICGLDEIRTQQEDSKKLESEVLTTNGNVKVTHPHLSDDNMFHLQETSYRGCLRYHTQHPILHHLSSNLSERSSDEDEAGVYSSFKPGNQTSTLLLPDKTASAIGRSHTNKDDTGTSCNEANRHLAVREQHVARKQAYTAPTVRDYVQASTSTLSTLRPARHPFQCSLCTRSFSQRGTLNRHMRSHLGVKPFPCPRCHMTFSRQYRVTEHMRVHRRCGDLQSNFTKSSTSSA
ncbi:zinc finger and BTB domain-containing protein 44-like [Phycodurus eques]|uniref:zinc finger and BTB domain-containing protein 44-like n=1 Tax=Phycodurus eques TaxID=693459 RepID=UPI002ACE0822|nr:zinc finger and BTB domain-containing protein 44-like [Phycodurus eques]